MSSRLIFRGVFSILLVCVCVFSASARNITFTVIDEQDNEPLIGASVILVDKPSIGTIANADGIVTIDGVPEEAPQKIKITYIGYKEKIVSESEISSSVKMTRSLGIELNEVEGIGDGNCLNIIKNNNTGSYTETTKRNIKSAKRVPRPTPEYPEAAPCIITECNNGYRVSPDQKQCICPGPRYKDNGSKCIDQKGKDCVSELPDGKLPEHGKSAKYEWDGTKLTCVLKCDGDYESPDNKTCVQVKGACTPDDVPHAKKGKMRDGKCVVTECSDGYHANQDTNTCECPAPQYAEKDGVCINQNKGDCSDTFEGGLPANAESAKYEYNKKTNTLVCKLKCKKDYKTDDNKTCVQSRGACSPDVPNATAGEIRDGKCVATACDAGYNLVNGTCEFDDTPRLSQEDHDKKIAELRENAQKMHDKEQSQANRVLGGATMMATGMGGMQMMSGMAEQKADEDAEQSMKAYLETFRCDYGMGRNIKGGETEIELPGANDLLPLVTEYKELAADLKIRKEALGKMPGIESEEIIDPATSGLYDNVGIGKTGGAYTSVARALMDKNSEDAKAWAEQKQDAHDKKNTGLKLLAGGAVASIAADLAINTGKGKAKEESGNINNKYESMKQKVEEINKHPVQKPAPCPSGATGTTSPNCVCTDQNMIYNPDANTCDERDPITCDGDLVLVNGECKCPGNKRKTEDNKCIDPQPDLVCDTGNPKNHLVLSSDGKTCQCADTFVQVEPADRSQAPTRCDCPMERPVINAAGQCVQKETQQQTTAPLTHPSGDQDPDLFPLAGNVTLPPVPMTLSASSLFSPIGSSTVEATAQKLLVELYATILKNGQTCTMTFIGYTDPIGKMSRNKTLSEDRAKAVRAVFEAAYNNDTDANKPKITFRTEGRGETECTCGVAADVNSTISSTDKETKICYGKDATQNVSNLYPRTEGRFAPCRRVVIETNCKSEADALGELVGAFGNVNIDHRNMNK